MVSIKSNQAFLSKAGEGELLMSAGMKLRVGSAQAGGAFELFEIDGPGSPLPHVHHAHDHCFFIIKGIFTFTVGTEKLEAPADSVVFIPRGVPHVFEHGAGARAIVFVLPSQLEGFFRELGEGLDAGRSEPELRAELAGKYDSWPVK